MGNTIRNPRKRPRQRSLNWRALWWLVRFQACFQVACLDVRWRDMPLSREWFLLRKPFRVEHWQRRWALYAPPGSTLP